MPALPGCDLIMKGGVTSGVVYPPAILKLANKFRFHSLGGASAGAIAAAVAAAAEYGRQTGPDNDNAGFKRLVGVESELKQSAFLLKRIKPEKRLAPLLEFFLGYRGNAQERSRADTSDKGRSTLLRTLGRVVRGLWRAVPFSSLLGALLALVLAAALSLGVLQAGLRRLSLGGTTDTGLGVALVTVFVCFCAVSGAVGWLAGGTLRLSRLLQKLNDKDQGMFGICKGSDGPRAVLSEEDSLALTDWLHVRINQLAGLPPDGPPLTIAQLAEQGVEFKLVSTNLTLGQPFILPMKRGKHSFFFKQADMAQLFPKPVVDYLVTWAKEHKPTKLRFKPGEDEVFLRFPLDEDLPVVVATRLSLSFPVLITAVRLYSFTSRAYDQTREKEDYTVDLAQESEEHWFSDGGIASNFPIHVFDAWVPVRPTFGITLYDSPIPDVLDRREVNKGSSVQLPRPNDFDKARPPRTRIRSLSELLMAVFDTAQSYRDTAQSGLPSYRERIVQVFLDEHEGGLNLDMTDETIQEIVAKGECAAQALIERYMAPEGGRYSDSMLEHRWVRLLVLMAQLEREVDHIRKIHPASDWKTQLEGFYRDLTQAQLKAREEKRPWYRPHDEAWCNDASQRLLELLNLVEKWDSARYDAQKKQYKPFLFADRPPRPEALLRVMPDL